MKRALGWVLFALGLFYLVHFFRENISEFDTRTLHLRFRFAFASVCLQVVGWALSACLWQYLMRRMGQTLSWRAGFIVHLLPQWTVYVPGRIVTLVERLRVFGRLQKDSRIATLATAGYELTMGLGALTVAAFFLPWLGWAPPWLAAAPVSAWLLFALSANTPLWRKWGQRWSRGRNAATSWPLPPIGPLFLLVTVGTQTLVWLLLGGAFCFLLLGLGMPMGRADAPLIGSYAVAKLGGYLAFTLPAGLGAQEATLVAVLQGKISPTFIASAVLGTRLFFGLVEGLGALAAFLWLRFGNEARSGDAAVK